MEEFLGEHLQRFLANVAITPSATRNNVPSGARKAIIRSLSELPLGDFVDPVRFAVNLDKWTCRIRATFTPRIPWGTARKCLNIFLRDATYNCYTRHHYQLAAVESKLEVPLDSRVALGLRRAFRELRREVPQPELARLPAWRSVKGLTQEEHAQYQNAATVIAHRYNTSRVHVDLRFFPAI